MRALARKLDVTKQEQIYAAAHSSFGVVALYVVVLSSAPCLMVRSDASEGSGAGDGLGDHAGGEDAVDAPGDVALERADRFATGFAFGEASCDVGADGRVDPHLGDRDDVERSVQSPVAGAVEAVAALFAAGGIERAAAAVGREVSRAFASPMTSSSASSDPSSRMCCGSRTSATCGPGRAGCTLRPSKTRSRGGSSAGAWRTTCARSWSSTR
jgi:hypothetical protein